MTIKIGFLGCTILHNPDMELSAVFTTFYFSILDGK
ncbi:MAG: hypothetical protein K0R23_807 [Lacrimispora sp.]|jgi:hypothetical protein|nr:hypothetical protein [Lacrimispora sp.]